MKKGLLILLVVFLAGCVSPRPSFPGLGRMKHTPKGTVYKEQFKWVKRSLRSEHFEYRGRDIVHVNHKGKETVLSWKDVKDLGIDSLKVQYLAMNAERE